MSVVEQDSDFLGIHRQLDPLDHQRCFFISFWSVGFLLTIINDRPITTEIGMSFVFAFSCIFVARLMICMGCQADYQSIPGSTVDSDYIENIYLSALRFRHTAGIGNSVL
jgi:hypothetical protein